VKKALSYRLFGLGSVPKRVRPVLEKEGIVVWDEGMKGHFITKDLKAPGRRSIHRSEGFSGWLAITQQRILCYTYRKRQINISIDDPKLSELFVCTPDPQTLSLSFESSVFREGWQGVVEFRFQAEKALQFADVLGSLGARHGAAEKIIKRLTRQDRLISEKRHALD
jgi:hypothetical protein